MRTLLLRPKRFPTLSFLNFMDQQSQPAPAQEPQVDSPAPPSAAPQPFGHKKLTQQQVNLLIFLTISFLLLVSFLLQMVSVPLDQLRLFGMQSSSEDLLTMLLPVRIGIAFVFMWYGIDNYDHPQVFNNLANTVLKKMKILKTPVDFRGLAYVQSVLEVF